MSGKRRRPLRTLIIVLVVLGVLLVGADRAAEAFAENRLATTAAQEAAQYDVKAADTSVEIGGFGFLPQVARERFDSITMTMQDPTIESVPAEDLVVTMNSVHVPRALLTGGDGPIVVDTADVRIRVSPSTLTRFAAVEGLSLRTVDGKLEAQLKVLGAEASVTVRPQVVSGGRIQLIADKLPGDVPAAVRRAVDRLLARGIRLPRLPFGASLKEISVQDQSVVITATAADLKLRG
ncbi:DUF2993 family protein [Kribbella amoyensis]|uniref:DUF2993 family protein n=1 Tax=Kribbella amoyensis TaxID=996641 RepID=A0A561BJQ6_9ACTN|nr:DUF2993 domain-containing protein [Kribbella amoyensis]TWD79119.1 DUF2993 family protein [Kribbella amoyensis]